MTTEKIFAFNELVIDRSQVVRVLGYQEGSLPEPFPEYLEQVLDECSKLEDIRGSFRIIDQLQMDGHKTSFFAEGLPFKVGKTIRQELEGSSRLALFVCTAGKTISEKSQQLLKGDDPVLGYVYDVLGSAIAEAVGDKVQQIIKLQAEKDGDRITNRYSPGYCHWHVEGQHQLFSLMGGSPCGVTLTPSALMYPVKSISGVIGIGKEVVFHDYQCELCNMQNCVFKEIHRL